MQDCVQDHLIDTIPQPLTDLVLALRCILQEQLGALLFVIFVLWEVDRIMEPYCQQERRLQLDMLFELVIDFVKFSNMKEIVVESLAFAEELVESSPLTLDKR
eukprot:CAMPEP_0170559486 /NCGR_PEP_ID=MMETSP0211-20121228/43061_1 /TAXON_ID=311385 /ORGANISM="Pseudokeronopsis sp., Strain OXSARD2" /LENGTH=102 /DNA_ID=CAMNT_0010872569 /DNA_START=243 /DNA_END=548 /DNA_ORIENTATION=-